MADITKILLTLGLIVVLLKRKWNLGIVMVLSSAILALLYLMPPGEYVKAFISASTDTATIHLLAVLTLIRVFEQVMREKGIMQEMMDAFRGMVMDKRVLMAAMPALIGLLPSMGGAIFSAPMVEEASKGVPISPEKKAFVNYMFRHPWEYISPLYPGLILASAITTFSVRDFIIANIPYAVALTLGGVIWGLGRLSGHREAFRPMSARGTLSFLPLFLILLLVMAFHLNLSLSMALVTAGLYVVFRYPAKKIAKSLAAGFSRDIIVIILGVMTFKAVLLSSGAVTNINAFFTDRGIPVAPVLFILPFLSGVLTGLTVGFVGSTFPILWGLEGAQNMSAMSFAFASGYVGVLLSPVHLCLVLTREYFGAEMTGIYKRIVKAGALIMVTAVLTYIVLSRI